MEYRTLEWPNDKTLMLIDLYKDRPQLWDPSHEFYKLASRKHDAWNEISSILECDVSELKKKMNSVLASFRRERQRERTKRTVNQLAYRSGWFAYKPLSFLKERFKHTPSKARVPQFQPEVHDIEDDADSDKDVPVEVEINHEDHLPTYIDSQTSQSPFEPPTFTEPFEGPSSVTNFYPQNSMQHDIRTKFKSQPLAKPRKHEGFPGELTFSEVLSVCQVIGSSRDESSVFGEHVANKLRLLDKQTRCIVEHSINNLLFVAQMGKLSQPDPKIFAQIRSNPAYGLFPTPSNPLTEERDDNWVRSPRQRNECNADSTPGSVQVIKIENPAEDS